MQRSIWMGVLAICASAASAQQPAIQDSRLVSGLVSQRGDSLVLTRALAIQLARTHNPQLDIAREQTAQFRAQRVQAIAFPDPQATASLDAQRGLFRSGAGGQRNVGAALTVPFPDKFRLRNNVANADIRNAEANYATVERVVIAATAEQYDSLLVALRHRGNLNEARTLSDDFLKRTQARFNAGTAPRLDVIKAQVDVARATNDLIANERDIVNSQSALDRLIGQGLGTVVIPSDTLAVPVPLPPLSQLLLLALHARPELAGLAAEREGARSATTLAREFWLPDLTLGFGRDLSTGAGPGLFSTGLAFPIPLFFWQHTRGEVSQAAHRERELAASYRDLEAQVGEDVRGAYANANTALRQAIYIRDQLLPSAREAFRAASASYTIGGSSAFEVIDARRTLLDAESQYSDALALANTSRSDLERAVSVPLDSISPGANNAQ